MADIPIIVAYKQMQDELMTVLNKYSKTVPAVFITQSLDNLATQFSNIADTQYKQAVKDMEVKKDANNRGKES